MNNWIKGGKMNDYDLQQVIDAGVQNEQMRNELPVDIGVCGGCGYLSVIEATVAGTALCVNCHNDYINGTKQLIDTTKESDSSE